MPTPNAPRSATYFAPVAAPRPFRVVGEAHTVLISEPASAVVRELCTLVVPESLSKAVPQRIRSYLAGRHCAARALERLTGSAPAVGRGVHGEPRWPAGLVGSITHSPTHAGAVVVAASQCRGVGIDCERIMSPATCDEIAGSAVPEIAAIALRDAEARALTREALVSIAFSAKESIFKCVFPLTGTYFEFHDIVIDAVDVTGGIVEARLATVFSRPAHVEPAFAVHLDLQPDQVFTAVRI